MIDYYKRMYEQTKDSNYLKMLDMFTAKQQPPPKDLSSYLKEPVKQ